MTFFVDLWLLRFIPLNLEIVILLSGLKRLHSMELENKATPCLNIKLIKNYKTLTHFWHFPEHFDRLSNTLILLLSPNSTLSIQQCESDFLTFTSQIGMSSRCCHIIYTFHHLIGLYDPINPSRIWYKYSANLGLASIYSGAFWEL